MNNPRVRSALGDCVVVHTILGGADGDIRNYFNKHEDDIRKLLQQELDNRTYVYSTDVILIIISVLHKLGK